MGVLKLFELASRMDKLGVAVTRAGLIVVLLWIGGLKAANPAGVSGNAGFYYSQWIWRF